MKHIVLILLVLSSFILSSFCKVNRNVNENIEDETSLMDTDSKSEEQKYIVISINDNQYNPFWITNEAVSELKSFLSISTLSISMNDYFDVGVGGTLSLSKISEEDIDVSYGDICIENSNQLIIFYDNYHGSYTKLGHISASKRELKDLLTDDDIEVILGLE